MTVCNGSLWKLHPFCNLVLSCWIDLRNIALLKVSNERNDLEGHRPWQCVTPFRPYLLHVVYLERFCDLIGRVQLEPDQSDRRIYTAVGLCWVTCFVYDVYKRRWIYMSLLISRCFRSYICSSCIHYSRKIIWTNHSRRHRCSRIGIFGRINLHLAGST